MSKTSITLKAAGGRDFFTEDQWSKRTKLNRLGAQLKALAAGMGGGKMSERTTLRAGTAEASGTVTCAAVQNADTVTINGQALTATQHHARGTVTPTLSGIDTDDTVTINDVDLTAKRHHATGTVTTVIANLDTDDTVTINGVAFTAKDAEDTEAGEFDKSGTDDAAATSLAACINASEDEDIDGVVTATAAANVVTIRAVATGTAGNSITLATSDADGAAVSGATLANATAPAADEFDITGTTAQCCTSLAAAVNSSVDLRDVVTAWASATVVTIRACDAGAGGNAITLASSDAQLAVSGATLSGGAAVANNQFDFGGSNTETAEALASAISDSTTSIVGDICEATNSAAVVTVKSRVKGTCGNAITLASSDGTRLAVSAARLTGGTDDEFTF